MVSLANFLEDWIVRNGSEKQHTAPNLYGNITKYSISLLARVKICLGDLDKAILITKMPKISSIFLTICISHFPMLKYVLQYPLNPHNNRLLEVNNTIKSIVNIEPCET